MVSLTFWGLATFGGVVTFGGSLLSGFITSHKVLTLLSGVVTFEGSLLSELYGSKPWVQRRILQINFFH